MNRVLRRFVDLPVILAKFAEDRELGRFPPFSSLAKRMKPSEYTMKMGISPANYLAGLTLFLLLTGVPGALLALLSPIPILRVLGYALIAYALFMGWFSLSLPEVERYRMGEKGITELLSVSSKISMASTDSEIVEALAEVPGLRYLITKALAVRRGESLSSALKRVAVGVDIPPEIFALLAKLDEKETDHVRSMIHESSVRAFSSSFKMYLSHFFSVVTGAASSMEMLIMAAGIGMFSFYATPPWISASLSLILLVAIYFFVVRPLSGVDATPIYGANFTFTDVLLGRGYLKVILPVDAIGVLISFFIFSGDPLPITILVLSIHIMLSSVLRRTAHILMKDLVVMVRSYVEQRKRMSPRYAFVESMRSTTNPFLREIMRETLSDSIATGRGLWTAFAERLPYVDLRPLFMDMDYVDTLTTVDSESQRMAILHKIEDVVRAKLSDLDEFIERVFPYLAIFSSSALTVTVMFGVSGFIFRMLGNLFGVGGLLRWSGGVSSSLTLIAPLLAISAFVEKKVVGRLTAIFFMNLSIIIVLYGFIISLLG